MRVVAGVLVLLVAPSAALRSEPSSPAPDTGIPFDGAHARQEWLADPILPECLAEGAIWPQEALTFEVPSLSALSRVAKQEPPVPPAEGSSFPRSVTGIEIQAWREERDLRNLRQWSSEALLGLPMMVPQFALESFLPRGVEVGPSTFLYRTSSPDSSLPLVVLDQILFHEAQFMANIQMGDDDPALSSAFTRGQKALIRRSFFSGFRATYAVPRLTIDQVFEVAAEQGIVGYLLAPPVAGAILWFKGMDQRIRPHDDLHLRIKLAGGEDWNKGTREVSGLPALSVELRLWNLPVGIIGSFEISSHGMIPEFLGIGSSLDAVEDLLIREGAIGNPALRER